MPLPTSKPAERKSSLAKAIEARPRPLEVFDVSGFFGLGGKPIEKIGIRVAIKDEEDAAVIAAHKHARDAAGDVEAAKADLDLLGDGKLIELLYRVCCDPGEQVGHAAGLPADKAVVGTGTYYPAFPSPGWMRSNVTTDQVATLYNLAIEVRNKYAPAPVEIDDGLVEALATACAEHSANDIPEALLAGRKPWWLTHAFVMLSKKLVEARAALAALSPPSEPQ